MSTYCSETNTRRFKARLRLNNGDDVTVFVYAQNQEAAKRLISAQYSGARIISGYVGLG